MGCLGCGYDLWGRLGCHAEHRVDATCTRAAVPRRAVGHTDHRSAVGGGYRLWGLVAGFAVPVSSAVAGVFRGGGVGVGVSGK